MRLGCIKGFSSFGFLLKNVISVFFSCRSCFCRQQWRLVKVSSFWDPLGLARRPVIRCWPRPSHPCVMENQWRRKTKTWNLNAVLVLCTHRSSRWLLQICCFWFLFYFCPFFQFKTSWSMAKHNTVLILKCITKGVPAVLYWAIDLIPLWWLHNSSMADNQDQ